MTEPGPADNLAELEAVQQTALRLLAGVPRLPATLRVQSGGVTLELEWGAGPAASVGPAVPVDVPLVEVTADHIHAPTVGVFYRAPAPGSQPFVEEGTVVSPGQQVALVEAMKLMIPVTADRHCRIVEAMLPDGTPVEFGQRLFVVAPVEEA
ncbi:hypothetical protein Lfu02_74570 [Longispora fulva]|uniref:Biotin carboxyl carrier protein of acetyl-CoA carboxylase n=1 Tax=Longispora fulva TaxID=619741 RepID=A0A8J7G5S7_9ACTN|nr:biotin/lipoyl-containing protein [Longispora fulva]MBG6134193.1 acetyl-CoA carboxylase biotin carboxyl carrier protein [Longispora fulva]GIG63085.1 hypothetical protein Lfu02_74570 [Longispora fulva]